MNIAFLLQAGTYILFSCAAVRWMRIFAVLLTTQNSAPGLILLRQEGQQLLSTLLGTTQDIRYLIVDVLNNITVNITYLIATCTHTIPEQDRHIPKTNKSDRISHVLHTYARNPSGFTGLQLVSQSQGNWEALWGTFKKQFDTSSRTQRSILIKRSGYL